MVKTTESHCAVESVKQLSEIIIEILKELSQNRKTLSTLTMSEALSQRREVYALFHPPAQGSAHGTAANDAPPDLQAPPSLKSQLQSLQVERDRLLTRIGELEVQIQRHNGPTDGVGRVNLLAPNSEGTEAELRWKTNLRSQDDEDQSISQAECLKQFQEVYVQIMEGFQIELGNEYLGAFTALKDRISQSKSLDSLPGLSTELLRLIRTVTVRVRDEREQFSEFAAQVSRDLFDLESSFLDSFKHTRETHRANESFNSSLGGQMDDIGVVLQSKVPLVELKSLIAVRLTAIKEFLESRQKENEARLNDANRKMENLRSRLQRMKREISEIHHRTQSLQREVLMDPLTGIHNRRAYERKVEEELERHRRYKHAFSLLLVDVDYFKRVNDSYGHSAGDRCLKELARRIKASLRKVDFFARYGGEEFIVLLPGTGMEGAYIVGERIREAVEKTRFIYQGQEIQISISIGVSQAEPQDDRVETLFKRADDALYTAKQAGRNRTFCSGRDAASHN